MLIGYMRVSSSDDRQVVDLQLDALLRSMRNMTTWFCDAYASKKAASKTPTADYGAGCRAISTLIRCPTKKSRTSS